MRKFAVRRVMLQFGLRIIEARRSAGITQEQLAEFVGISRRQMNRVEAGKANISLELIAELGIALEVDLSSLFVAPRKTTVRRSGRPRATEAPRK